jgi:hypothetical protein
MTDGDRGDRGDRGRFRKGCKPGPGRPPAQREAEYLNVVLKACSLPRWKRIVARAVADAEAGDRFARAFLADRILGRAVERVVADVTTREAEEEFRVAGKSRDEIIAGMLVRLADSANERNPGLAYRILAAMARGEPITDTVLWPRGRPGEDRPNPPCSETGEPDHE